MLTCVRINIESHHIKIAMGCSLWPLLCKKITCLKKLAEASPMARTCSIKKLDWHSFISFEFCFEILNIEHGNLVCKKVS